MNLFKVPYPVDSPPPLIAGAVKKLYKHSNVPVELAAPSVLGVASLVRKRYSQTGTYFGVRPVKLCNGRLGWPAEFVKKSIEGGAA